MPKIFIVLILNFTIVCYSQSDSENWINYQSTNHKSTMEKFPTPPEWVWQDLGNHIGHNIMEAVDVDSDGSKELILGSNGIDFTPGNYVTVLSSNLRSVQCVFDFDSIPQDIHISQMDDDPALEITIASMQKVIVADGKTCEIASQYDIEGELNSIALGDLNNDNITDVVYSISYDLYISSIDDMGNPIIQPGLGGERLIVEPADRAGGDDIGVFLNSIVIIHGENLSVINEFNSFTSELFHFGDVDGDGLYEVVSFKSGAICMVNLSSGDIVAEHQLSVHENYDTLRLQDVNADSKADILLGNNQWGDVIIKDYLWNDLFRINNPRNGTSNVLFTDIDDDGLNEVLFGAGHSATDDDNLFRADWNSQQLTWNSINLDGPYVLSNGFIENEEGQNSIAISARSQFSNTFAQHLLINTNTGAFPILEYPYTPIISAIDTGYPNSSDNPFVCSSDIESQPVFVKCFDAFTNELMWYRVVDDYSPIYFMKMMHLDSNSSLDILIVNNNGAIHSLNASNGYLNWQSEHALNNGIYFGFKDAYLFDQILWVLHNNVIYKINPNTGATLEVIENTGLSSMDLVNNKLYAAKIGEGFGILNTNDLSIPELIYSEKEPITYLEISEDEKIAFISTGSSNVPIPEMDITLVSIQNEFVSMHIGDVNVYDVSFPDQLNLYLSNEHGVRKYDLKFLNEKIFKNGFESL